uniref:Uncharacterized protein n=1 Tax=Medicago truncatula TaxID=3880 RepID=A2Q1J2_MEDTR|nr:hypothetical protein MtrDRAFT_AC148819g27v2 [Medicago truncatula]
MRQLRRESSACKDCDSKYDDEEGMQLCCSGGQLVYKTERECGFGVVVCLECDNSHRANATTKRLCKYGVLACAE